MSWFLANNLTLYLFQKVQLAFSGELTEQTLLPHDQRKLKSASCGVAVKFFKPEEVNVYNYDWLCSNFFYCVLQID